MIALSTKGSYLSSKSPEPAADDDDLKPRELNQFLTYRVVRVHHALNAQAVAVLDRVAGITLPQWRVLAMVGSGLATTARDIAKKSIIDPAMISRTVHGLEETGHMTTSRPDSDRRVLQITLTEKGREVYERILPNMQARQESLLGALEPSERDAIYKILDKLEIAAERREFDT